MSGRVDNLCYYQQKRVRGGLVRRINLAMSERVKAGEEYAPLRRYNSFFGACSMFAAGLLSLMNQRTLFMTRSDRQSFLTTRIMRELLRSGYNRYEDVLDLSGEYAKTIPPIFNSLMKVRAKEFFFSLPTYDTEVPTDANIVFEISSAELENYLDNFKGIAVYINWYYDCRVGLVVRNSETNKYDKPNVKSTINRRGITWYPGDGDVEVIASAGLDTGEYSCIILRFDVAIFDYGGRYLYSDSASTAHMIGLQFN